MTDTIMLSGGFDPLHIGHVQMVQDAARYGDVIVVVNTDEWLMRKKGYIFMPSNERIHIMQALKGVVSVFSMNAFKGSDNDGTVIEAIRAIKPTYFANGGDRTKKNVPEQPICESLGVKMLWAIGGDTKPQSSSWLVNAAIDQMRQGGKL